MTSSATQAIVTVTYKQENGVPFVVLSVRLKSTLMIKKWKQLCIGPVKSNASFLICMFI